MDRVDVPPPSKPKLVYFPHSTKPVGNYKLVDLETGELVLRVQACSLKSAMSKLALRLNPSVTYTARFMYTGLATKLWDI